MQLLGGRSPAQFLAEHWQKKPLLVRQAIPGFTGFLGPQQLCELAAKKDASARVVKDSQHKEPRKRFRLEEGPFRLDAHKVPAERWTLLVQHIEEHHDEGWPLLLRFADVVPLSRIGDLMVSWAKTSGSVGAHVDAYDVFLLQGSGKRRWQIDDGPPHDFDVGDVRTLKDFRPTNEWILEPGDLLYLPPHVGHHGVAVDDTCMTWSIGFTAPSTEQLLQNWLAYQSQQHENASGFYEDKDLTVPDGAGALDDPMIARLQQLLQAVAPTKDAVTTFSGRLLTGRPGLELPRPKQRFDEKSLVARLQQAGQLRLHNKSRLLWRPDRVFLNGDEATTTTTTAPLWSTLANTRALSLPLDNEQAAALAHDVVAFVAAGAIVVV